MKENINTRKTRRQFLKHSSIVAAGSVLASSRMPHVYAAEDNTIRLALIGAGGRGTGAVVNAFQNPHAPTKLVAIADIFDSRVMRSYGALHERYEEQVDVPEDQKFVGFDAYRHAMDCLRPGDIAIFGSPPAFRWVHFAYAIEKGLNVFMEKPVTVDGPTSRRMLEQARQSEAKNLKVGVGLMVRHCEGRIELHDRIQSGEIGDIISMRAYRMHGPVGSCFSEPKPADISEVLYQTQRFHSFLWASGGLYSDFYIHQVDECSWMKNAWPVSAQAVGGRHVRGKYVDQNFDNYSVEYTFSDGTNFYMYGRTMDGCHQKMSSYAHGTEGSAIISAHEHAPGRVRIFKGQDVTSNDPVWAFPQPEENPYQLEWDNLIYAIINDEPFNEVKRGVEASLVTSMGRMAAHTGHVVTYDQILNSEHEFAPDVDKLTEDGPAPVAMGPDNLYPQPQPGIVVDREY